MDANDANQRKRSRISRERDRRVMFARDAAPFEHLKPCEEFPFIFMPGNTVC